MWSSQKISDQLATVLGLKWTEKFILCNAADAFISPSLPLSRDGTMASMDFYAQSIPAVATTITVKKNGTTLSPTISLSAAGLVDCIVTCNQKWVNR